MKQRLLFLVIGLLLLNPVFSFTRAELSNVIIFHQDENNDTLVQIDEMLGNTRNSIESYFQRTFDKRTLYIYKTQKEFQKQKHPIATAFIKLDWYIGDNIGEKALIVSPNTKVSSHTYKSIINAIPHEYIHTVVYSINKKCPLWINEGIALFLSNRHNVSTKKKEIPPIGIFKSNNSLYFEKHNGYSYADKFIEFVELKYGHSKVLELVNTGNYEKVLGEELKVVYLNWVEYLKTQYP